MKIAILHHDIEPAELKFLELFKNKGHETYMHDIRYTDINILLDYDIVINRVYSSVASRDHDILNRTLELLNQLEENKILCINPYSATLADYNKYALYKMLSKKGINTPPSYFIDNIDELRVVGKKAINEFGFPLVVKRNCGGKSYEVTRVNSYKDLNEVMRKMFIVAESEGYRSGFLLQKFIKSIREHDCRIAFINGKYSFAYARSFITRNSTDKWMASTSGGSKEFEFEPTKEEIELAKKANKAIGALFSESDVIMTNEGPYIIEVNPTPGYFVEDLEDIKRMESVVNTISTKVKPKKLIIVEVRGKE